MNLKYTLLLILVSLTINSFGQQKIDKNISVTFPQKPKIQDFSENIESAKAELRAFYLNTEKESFIVFRTVLIEEAKEVDKLPSSERELNEIYNNDIKSQINSMEKKGFIFSDSTKLNIENFKAYRLKYALVDSKEQGAESILLFLNGVRYVITYSKVSTFNENNKNQFLNSISISDQKTLLQVTSTTNNGFVIFEYALYFIVAIGLFLYFRRASKNKSELGINLNAVYCPKCNTKQPFIRMPKNTSQLLYGGTTCPNCKISLDKYGRINA